MSFLSVEKQFLEYMLADATISGRIGARLYDRQLPQQPVFPCAVFQRLTTTRPVVHSAQGSFSNSGRTRFQLKILGDPAAAEPTEDTRAITQAFIDRLQTFNAYDGSSRGQNNVTNQYAGVEAETQPPIPYERLDIMINFADNT